MSWDARFKRKDYAAFEDAFGDTYPPMGLTAMFFAGRTRMSQLWVSKQSGERIGIALLSTPEQIGPYRIHTGASKIAVHLVSFSGVCIQNLCVGSQWPITILECLFLRKPGSD
jgi:hypothetical protein